MEQIAPDVFLLDGFPKHAINVYLMGDVLVDAGPRMDKNASCDSCKGTQ